MDQPVLRGLEVALLVGRQLPCMISKKTEQMSEGMARTLMIILEKTRINAHICSHMLT